MYYRKQREDVVNRECSIGRSTYAKIINMSIKKK